MKRNHWQILLVTVFSMLSFAGLLTVSRISASPDAVLSVDPYSSTAALGQSFSVAIIVTDVSELYMWQFNLTFNPAVVNVTDVTEGPFLKDTGSTFWGFTKNDIHNNEGWVFVGCSLFPLPEHGATGSGVLATVTLTSKMNGLSNLHFSGVSPDNPQTSLATWDFSLNSGKPIVFSAVDGVFAYPLWRDLAVTNAVASPTSVPAGESVSVNMTVRNLGNFTETFNATAYYGSTAIGTRTDLTVGAGTDKVVTITWDTTGVSMGSYTIKAGVKIAGVENDTTNNVLTDGTVTIELVHDVAVTDVAVSPLSVTSGGKIYVNATVMNKGSITETFDVTLSYDSTVVETETVTNLAPGASEPVNFVWETKDVAVGDYKLTVKVGPVSDETQIADNIYSNVLVKVRATSMLPLELLIGIIAIVIAAVGCGAFFLLRRKSKKA